MNADDPLVARFAEVAPGRVVTFGVAERADFRAENIQDRGLDGTEFDFLGPEGRARLRLPLAGRHNISNALAALAAASVWGVGAAEAREVFPELQATGMRGRVLQYDAGFTVINDCYNSNPVALGAMIELLTQHSGVRPPHSCRRRNAGAWRQLPPSCIVRRGAPLRQTGKLDWIIGVQGDAESFVRGRDGSRPSRRAHANFFASSAEAGEFLADLVERGDVLLVKGSRGVKMERIVEALDAQLRARECRAGCSAAGGAPKERG